MPGRALSDEAIDQLARSNAELELRLAERTIERDEFARVAAITELARSNAELEVRLAERTIERDDVARDDAVVELARTDKAEESLRDQAAVLRDQAAALRHQAAELKALNAELESFSYSVSHDLRAPVRAVLGFTRALAEDHGAQLDDEGRRLLSVVVEEAARMGDLIDDLLAFSRLGRQPIVNAVVNMTQLATDVAAEEASLAGNRRPLLVIEPMPDVRGDHHLLRQTWVNLLSNAVKYSGKAAAPEIHVWATVVAGRCVYNVRDNGVGFDLQYADKLFGVFQRLHRSDEFPGTGVGLAIVKRIIERHGGTVWADARLGEGATFSFALPARELA